MTSEPQETINGILIRPMVEADLAQVMDLEREIFPDPWPKSAFEEQFENSDWGSLVAESGGVITGYACFMVAGEEAHLTNIAVAKAFRRKSVAKRLLEPILEVVKEKGCEFILLEVRPSNTGAIAFYERSGFRELYKRPRYYRSPQEDALVMVRYLDES